MNINDYKTMIDKFDHFYMMRDDHSIWHKTQIVITNIEKYKSASEQHVAVYKKYLQDKEKATQLILGVKSGKKV